MVFRWAGRTYDTAHMTEYATDDPAVPGIYVTPDGRDVFVVTITRWQGVDVHRAEAEEIRQLAQRFGLPQLLSALA